MKTIPNELFFEWAEAELARKRNVAIRVKGNSMYPFLRSEKDEVLLSPCHASELKQMDVVLFRYRGRHVLHRIIHLKDERVVLRGDGIYGYSEECAVTDVLGKVTKIRRNGRAGFSTTNLLWQCAGWLWYCSYPLRRLKRWLMMVD